MLDRHVAALTALLLVSGCEPYPGTGTTTSSSGGSGATPPGGSGASSGDWGGRRPINSDKLCSRLTGECGQPVTMEVCKAQFTAILVTGACADALARGSCDELLSSTSPLLTTCFPPCSGTLAACNEDGSITICTASGTTNVLDCEEACKADGARAYSGTCGTSHGVQVSDRPRCWCQ